MLPNSNNIKIACKKIYKLLASTKKLTFKQLQKLSGLNDINLCRPSYIYCGITKSCSLSMEMKYVTR